MTCEPVAVEADGWSEWLHPSGDFLMECCDCGLVHVWQFEIVPRDASNTAALNPGESDEAVIIFRARRHEPPAKPTT